MSPQNPDIRKHYGRLQLHSDRMKCNKLDSNTANSLYRLDYSWYRVSTIR